MEEIGEIIEGLIKKDSDSIKEDKRGYVQNICNG